MRLRRPSHDAEAREQGGCGGDAADTLEEAAENLSGNRYDLVLVNQELAADGSEGLELIRQMKKAGDQTPVMLVSDLPDAQEQAVACGAIAGFGKSKLGDRKTVALIGKAIGL